MKEAQHPSHVVNGRKIPNSEDNTISEDERSNQVVEDRTLLDFHEDGAKIEAKESNQEVEAPIKVYQQQKVLDGVTPTSIRKFQQLRSVPMYFKAYIFTTKLTFKPTSYEETTQHSRWKEVMK
jgi:hypothetical protein